MTYRIRAATGIVFQKTSAKWFSLGLRILMGALALFFLVSESKNQSAAQPADGPSIRTVAGDPIYDPARGINKVRPGFEPDRPPYGNAAVNARLWAPMGLAIDEGGHLFISDILASDIVDSDARPEVDNRATTPNQGGPCGPCHPHQSSRLRKIRDGHIATVGHSADAAGYGRRQTLHPDSRHLEFHNGDLYVAGFWHIVKITPGQRSPGERYAEVSELRDVSGDPNDPLPPRAESADPSEQVVRVAGSFDLAKVGDDGTPATSGGLYDTLDMAFDKEGNMFVASSFTNAVRRVDAGDNGTIDGCRDEVTPAGEEICRPLDPTETWMTVAGLREQNHSFGYYGDGVPARAAPLWRPAGVAIDMQGNVLISDTYNHRIRKVFAGIDGKVTGTDDEVITTVAGKGCGQASLPTYGRDDRNARPTTIAGQRGWDGDEPRKPADDASACTPNAVPANGAYLDTPRDIEIDGANNLYIADGENDRVRRVSPGDDGDLGTDDDTITTVAGRNDAPPGRDSNAGANPLDHDPARRRCHDREQAGGLRPCPPLDVKLEHPYGLAIAPCAEGHLTTKMYVSEWMNRRVREISGVAQCPKIDLAIEDIVDTPDSVLVNSDLTYVVKATNKGLSESTGVDARMVLDPSVALKSASSSKGDCTTETGAVDIRLICPLGRMSSGESIDINIVVTPAKPGEIFLQADVRFMDLAPDACRDEQQSPCRKNDDTPSDNIDTEKTTVVLPGVPAVAGPQVPCLVACGSGEGGPPVNPPPGSTPPGASSVDTNQSSITVTTPPGGPASAAPSTVPVSSPASQPLGQQVPLTGSLGFQAGPASATAPASAPTVPEWVGAGAPAGAASALADASDEQQSKPAPRLSMVSHETALQTGVSLMGAVFLAGLACMVVVRPLPSRAAPAPGWGAGPGRSTPGTRPAVSS